MSENEIKLESVRLKADHADHKKGDTIEVTPFVASKLKGKGIAEAVPSKGKGASPAGAGEQ